MWEVPKSVSSILPSRTDISKRSGMRRAMAMALGLLALLPNVALAQATSGSSKPGVNLNLSSTSANVSAGSLFKSSSLQQIIINVMGGTGKQVITPTSLITPAEYAAARETLSGGQSLTIGSGGNAVG